MDLSLPWNQQPMVMFDVETTGVEPEQDRIVEVGLVRFEPGGDVSSSWGKLVYPKCEIPDEVTAIHGISTSDVAAFPPFAGVVGPIINMGRDAIPAAYNADFDRRFLRAEAGRLDLPDFTGVIPILDPTVEVWLDPLVWVRWLHGFWGKKLTKVCEDYGIAIESAHRATDDALAAGKLMYAISDRMPDVPLGKLLQHQDELALAQSQEFEEWKQRKIARGEWRGDR